jgi:hypothetical protein
MQLATLASGFTLTEHNPLAEEEMVGELKSLPEALTEGELLAELAEGEWKNLPDELLLMVLDALGWLKCGAVRATCTRWRAVHDSSCCTIRAPLADLLDLAAATPAAAASAASMSKVLRGLSPRLPALTSLDLGKSPVMTKMYGTDEAVLQAVSGFPALSTLSFKDSGLVFTSGGLRKLAGCTTLRSLDLGGCAWRNEAESRPGDGLAADLSRLTALAELSLCGWNFAGNTGTISALTNLTKLDLSFVENAGSGESLLTNPQGVILVSVFNLPALTDLNLHKCKAVDNVIALGMVEMFSKLTQLSKLNLGCSRASGPSRAEQSEPSLLCVLIRLPCLTELDVFSCHDMSTRDGEMLCTFPKLTTLRISNTMFSAQVVEKLTLALPRLVVDAGSYDDIDDEYDDPFLDAFYGHGYGSDDYDDDYYDEDGFWDDDGVYYN